MQVENRLRELGIEIPDFESEGYYGATVYGTMKPYHRIGNVIHLSGHMPLVDGEAVLPGRVGGDLTLEQGYEAARITGINAIAGLKQALGDLDRVAAIVKTLNFVAAAPDFVDVNLVAAGLTDVMVEVFGEIAVCPRATIGCQSLSGNCCFESWIVAEARD